MADKHKGETHGGVSPLAVGAYVREAGSNYTLKSTEVEPLSSCTNS